MEHGGDGIQGNSTGIKGRGNVLEMFPGQRSKAQVEDEEVGDSEMS